MKKNKKPKDMNLHNPAISGKAKMDIKNSPTKMIKKFSSKRTARGC